jgi:hypothetical protein
VCLDCRAADATKFQVRKTEAPFYTLEGGQAAYTFTLLSQPLANVFIQLQPDDSLTELSSNLVVFTAQNWSTPHYVIIHGTDDNIIRPSPYHSNIHMTTSSLDNNFNVYNNKTGRGIQPVSFSVLLFDSDEGLCSTASFDILLIVYSRCVCEPSQ